MQQSERRDCRQLADAKIHGLRELRANWLFSYSPSCNNNNNNNNLRLL